MNCNISLFLDTRRSKDTEKYPLKLRVYNKFNKKVKLYSLNIDLTEKEYQNVWLNTSNKNLRGKNKELRLKLQAIETRANEEAEQMTVFDFAKFETKLFRKSSDKNSVKYHFEKAIAQCLKEDKVGTSESYKYTLKSIADFSLNQKKRPINKLSFDEITINWLNDYERFMLNKNKSITTISIYTRTLRVIFNNAIRESDISRDIYPFGTRKEGKYQISKTKKVKKALNSQQLNTLFNAKAETEQEQLAKDFWFFSYTCNGINLKDIALLKYSNIKNDKFTYFRAKTFGKSIEKTPITIYLNDFSKSIIKKYGNNNKSSYIFNIVKTKESSEQQHKKIKNFTRLINDHIKRIAKRYDLPNDISTYWARHSFASNSIRKGASMEFISEALNHSNLSVTKNYFAGFEDEAKKEFAKNILDF
ncbi:site-specific integrase [uncultured Tenacibaculum sp.]|uniref:tyrosine-type recombinase/integrase n=1 Tax=uncultured Tenacibaculum sp. TaxID=174713 RepID=UPI00260B6416|nr:site-specific integrase [uncultured Tenacibaculum sp.]